MKKFLSLLLVGVMLVTCALTLASCGGTKFEFELNEDGASYALVGMENVKGEVVVPSTYNGLPVTKIASNAVDSKAHLTSLVLPDSILEIEDYFLSGNLNKLESVTIGKNVTYIEDYAFSNSSTLEFKEINYCGTPEQWRALCRYQTSTYGGETKEFTKVYDDQKITVNYNYVMPTAE